MKGIWVSIFVIFICSDITISGPARWRMKKKSILANLERIRGLLKEDLRSTTTQTPTTTNVSSTSTDVPIKSLFDQILKRKRIPKHNTVIKNLPFSFLEGIDFDQEHTTLSPDSNLTSEFSSLGPPSSTVTSTSTSLHPATSSVTFQAPASSSVSSTDSSPITSTAFSTAGLITTQATTTVTESSISMNSNTTGMPLRSQTGILVTSPETTPTSSSTSTPVVSLQSTSEASITENSGSTAALSTSTAGTNQPEALPLSKTAEAHVEFSQTTSTSTSPSTIMVSEKQMIEAASDGKREAAFFCSPDNPDLNSWGEGSAKKGICSSSDDLEKTCGRVLGVFEAATSEQDCGGFEGNWCCYVIEALQ